MNNEMIKVLVVDDSKVARELLTHLLQADPQLQVVGAVDGGHAAIDFLKETKADVVLMDIQMPRLDGFETTRRIMETDPLPIVICTAASDPREMATAFRSMEAGAVACVGKPVGSEHPEYKALATELIQTLKLMSEVKVVRRWTRTRSLAPVSAPQDEHIDLKQGVRAIGIGASTGGPPILQAILAGLPKDFSVPLLIVQHIAPGFLSGLIEWLNQTTGLHIHIASHGTIPLLGHVYFAPDDLHMGLSAGYRIQLTREEPESGLRPSVSYLFRSLAESSGPHAIGILLSGMGKDGAAELKLMRDKGATTIAQDKETSVVHGMPGEAINIGAATHILPGEKIADTLIGLVRRKNVAGGVKS
jgi:two-component system, chemotaxis family, protein-glutamate methylesterase/glutaminase